MFLLLVEGPTPGVEVALFFDDEYGFNVVDTADTGTDGSYVFHSIAPGKYKLFAYDPKEARSGWSADWTDDGLALYDKRH